MVDYKKEIGRSKQYAENTGKAHPYGEEFPNTETYAGNDRMYAEGRMPNQYVSNRIIDDNRKSDMFFYDYQKLQKVTDRCRTPRTEHMSEYYLHPYREYEQNRYQLIGEPENCQTNASSHAVKKTSEHEKGRGDEETPSSLKSFGKKKIQMKYITDRNKRSVTFSKRKKGIMKKAYELNVLTDADVLLLITSESGHVYTFATQKLQPIVQQYQEIVQSTLSEYYNPTIYPQKDQKQNMSLYNYLSGRSLNAGNPSNNCMKPYKKDNNQFYPNQKK